MAKRGQLHGRIAKREEDAYGKRASEIAAELAHHNGQANYYGDAAKYFQLAGESALCRFANRQAEAHFRSALRTIEKMLHTTERDERELKALTGLRVAVAAIEGIGSDQLVPLLTRSAELCRRLCRDSELAEALHVTAFHHMYAGDMAQAAALGWEALDIATRANDSPQVALSYNALGSAHHWMGHFGASRAELEKALSFDRSHDGARKNVDAAAGALIVALLLLSRDFWMLGFPDQSRMRRRQCLEIANRINDPFFQAQAKAFGADIDYYCGEVGIVDQRTTEVQNLLSAVQSAHPQLIGWTRMLAGWVRGARGQSREALSLIRDGYDVILASRNRIAMPIFGCLMANALIKVGRPSEGLLIVNNTSRSRRRLGNIIRTASCIACAANCCSRGKIGMKSLRENVLTSRWRSLAVRQPNHGNCARR